MSLHSKLFAAADLIGAVYDFENIGDLLPMHDHDDKTNHITIVARGAFVARGMDWERVLSLGSVIQFEPYEQHEFVALERDSRLVNIRMNRPKE